MERLANVLRDALAWLADFGLATLVAFGVCGMFAFTWWMFRDVCRRYSRKFVVIALPVCIAAAIFADKRSGTGTTGDPPVGDGGGSAAMQGEAMSPLPEDEGITNLCFTAISCYTNTLEENVVSLDLAWPENFFDAGTTIDILSTTSLVDSAWGWLQSHVVSANETNWTMTVVATNGSCFYKTVVRDSLDDMDDPDGDGLPNVYEAAHGRNPWVDDYAAVQKLTVGPNGWFADVEDAIAASVPYSVIELDPSVMHEATNHTGMAIPQHPVMVTAPYSYAVIHATGISAFMLATNTTSRTTFRNLYVLLDAKPPRDSFQVGFWCGGNLPWSGVPASATFENIYLRMPNPGVQYRGWLFYRSSADPAMLLGCTLNAAGSTWALGIDAYGSPPLGIDGCSFIHFPPDGATGVGCGVRLRASASSDEGTDVAISRTLFDESFTNAWPIVRSDSTSPYFVTVSNCISPRAFPDVYLPDATGDVVVADAALTWSGIPYANSPSVPLGIGSLMPIADDQSVDSDGDGISDYEEVYDRNLDPFLADTDNDGVDDRDEIDDETDPTDPYSFKQTLVVSITNKVSLSYPIRVAWGYSEAGWETNGLAVFPAGHGSTSYTNASSQGATHVKAFCDLNDDGEYDAAHDILLVRPIPYGSTAQINFVFGDVDGDGVSDSQERTDGSDPYDGKNFRMAATVNIESSDVALGLTNFVACGLISAGWSTGENSSFVGSTLQFSLDAVATNGEVFVKVFRDFNANGIYDVGVDALVVKRLTGSDWGKTIEFPVGDSDGDRILDSVELEEGTNPLSSYDYCFNLSLTYTDVFHTTNALTFTAFMGTNLVYGPCVAEGSVWMYDFGHCVAAAGERVLVNVWDDANHNGEWDAGETSNRYTVAITSHDMVVTNSLSYGNFDRDNNMIPDWWEMQEGLAAEGVARRAYDDPDGDGLINLHEFWCGTHPLVPDGSNTLLSVASRSIDDRLLGKSATNSLCLFENYFENGTNGVFQTNANFWASDVDFSGISVWNSSNLHNERAGALVSPQHLLMANHWYPSSTNEILYFRGKSGVMYSRVPIRWQRVSVSSMLSTYPDTVVILLNEPLNTNDVSVISVFSTNLLSKVRDGYAVPFLYLNRKKEALIKEVRSLTLGGDVLAWHHISFMRPTVIGRQTFVTDVLGIPGDSSSPSFILIGNKPVLFGIHSRTTSDAPVFLFTYQIQQAMDSLKSGESLLIEDVSMFPDVQ